MPSAGTGRLSRNARSPVAGGAQHRTGRLFANLSDHHRFPTARRMQRVDGAACIIGSHHRQELSLVRNVKRIEPEQFAGAADRIAHGNPILPQNDSLPRVARQLVE